MKARNKKWTRAINIDRKYSYLESASDKYCLINFVRQNLPPYKDLPKVCQSLHVFGQNIFLEPVRMNVEYGGID